MAKKQAKKNPTLNTSCRKNTAYLKPVQCRDCGNMTYNGNTIKGRFICNRCQGKPIAGQSEKNDKDREYEEALRKSMGLTTRVVEED